MAEMKTKARGGTGSQVVSMNSWEQGLKILEAGGQEEELAPLIKSKGQQKSEVRKDQAVGKKDSCNADGAEVGDGGGRGDVASSLSRGTLRT